MTNLTHNSFLCIYFNSLYVSSNLVLIIRRINCINTSSDICHSVWVTVSCAGRKVRSAPHTERSLTQSDIYQMLYWYNSFSWWWTRGCSKHVENWNKYIEKNCASSWSFTKNHVAVYVWVVCFVLGGAYVGQYTDYKNMHLTNNKIGRGGGSDVWCLRYTMGGGCALNQ